MEISLYVCDMFHHDTEEGTKTHKLLNTGYRNFRVYNISVGHFTLSLKEHFHYYTINEETKIDGDKISKKIEYNDITHLIIHRDVYGKRLIFGFQTKPKYQGGALYKVLPNDWSPQFTKFDSLKQCFESINNHFLVSDIHSL